MSSAVVFAKNRSDVMERSDEEEKQTYEKNKNYDIGSRRKCRNGSGGHQIGTSEEL